MDSSIWFYTFSTAAQVMAALIGLFAVFVVYKIQDSSQLLNDARFALSRLLPYVSGNTPGAATITREEVVLSSDKEILQLFAGLLLFEGAGLFAGSETIGNITFLSNSTTYHYVSGLVNRKTRILSKLVFTLALSFCAIALSLIALVCTSVLTPLGWFIWLALVLFLACLVVIAVNTYQITLE